MSCYCQATLKFRKTEALRLKRAFKVSKDPGHAAWRLYLECDTNKNMILIRAYLGSDNPSIS